MTPGALGRRLLTHVALRLVAATVLLGVALLTELRAPGDFSTSPLFIGIAAVYAVSLAFIASLRFVDRLPWLTDVHFAIDVLVVSACVSLDGGLTSLFSSLYVLPIVAASSIQFRRGALQVAGLAALSYSGIVLTQYLQGAGVTATSAWIGQAAPLPSVGVAQYTVALNVSGFFAVALLSGALAERVRRADVKLERASEEIADLQFFNQYVIDSLVSGLATADEDKRVLTFNRSASLITGHAPEAVVGRSATEVLQLPEDFAVDLESELQRTRSKRIDIDYRKGDERTISLGLSVAKLPLPNGRRGYLYTFQDVTELRRLEREAQLQKRLAAVGEMAAGIAHEIRNPLASMSGSMQILRQELQLSNDQAHLMDIVLRESDRLNDTIRSFLAYARPQRSAPKRLDLRHVLRETATLLRNSHEVIDEHTIEVSQSPTPVAVEADEGQVRQIVWNLATNALRAMPDGGTLTLQASSDAHGSGGAVLTVADEGIGIAADEIERVFQPYRTSFGRGTGLGLAIVHRIASDYHATIDVQSQPGKGTTFSVNFPPPPRATADKSARQAPRPPITSRSELGSDRAGAA